ncbi:NAD(P)-dependent alcohol dehydrogenase [Actinomadura rudentiformis]|uniref:NAD(P)-dependent alcohol dehydrogenase n=1 Tax=Actinomadura rudentiformis TaxID=359158 RepID=A0A6H9Y561_9ACTN|nr:NAD(P)-dependent alcohol dehydrogenase [Actinomadura rudentiformis]KAB2337802.1 NAD(P)-dependent alcohol dehydrogenase [Actinomadura rudentiformis]
MRAIIQDTYGSADVLRLSDIDRPEPRDTEVLIRVHAAGVGPDVWHLMTGIPYMVRLGMGLRRPRQRVRGWDVAGVVAAVGSKVTRFEPGDEVFGVGPGSFAEYTVAKESKIAPKPATMSFEQAAAIPISGVTALQAVRDKGRLGKGQKVLVIGASGGVGTFAVQLAAHFGAEVTGVCGPGKDDLLRSLGATEVIDYTLGDITGDGRYDLILDGAGNRPLSSLRRMLAPKGTLVLVGGEEGGKWLGMGRNVQALALGPFTGQRLAWLLAVTKQDDLMALKEMADKGELTPAIDRTYPLEEAADAVRHLTEGHPRGKVVVTI